MMTKHQFQIFLQVAAALVFVLASLHGRCASVRGRHDLLSGDPVRNAVSRLLLHPSFQLENDQGNGILHVLTLFCVRCYFALF